MLTPEYCEKQGMSCDICPINDCEYMMGIRGEDLLSFTDDEIDEALSSMTTAGTHLILLQS